MPFVTLISAPGARALSPDTVETLRGAWGGEPVRWLAPREAAEFEMPAIPSHWRAVRDDLAGLGLDLAVQETRGPKRMLIADMDSTLIQQECIDELAAEAGIGGQVAEITEKAMNGLLDFEGALRARVGLLQGVPAAVIDTVLDRRIALTPGAATLVATMKAAGAYTLLVSGGFTAFAERVAQTLGIDEARANRLVVVDGALTGAVADPILGRDAKVAALNQVAGARSIPMAEVVAVGDGANDLGMLDRAGLGVALHAKPVVAERADVRIDHGDLTALLYLQGYAERDFATA